MYIYIGTIWYNEVAIIHFWDGAPAKHHVFFRVFLHLFPQKFKDVPGPVPIRCPYHIGGLQQQVNTSIRRQTVS